MAMVMGLCLLVYSLGQRALRQALDKAQQTVKNQVGKSTAKPILRLMPAEVIERAARSPRWSDR